MKHLFDFRAKASAADIERLISDGANPNVKNNRGISPFMMAACFGYESCARALLKAGADKNHRDNEGNTALMMASYAGQTLAVKFLIEIGADPDIRDHDGNSVFSAMRMNALLTHEKINEVSSLLLAAGAKPDEHGHHHNYIKEINIPSLRKAVDVALPL